MPNVLTLCGPEHLNSFQVYNARHDEFVDPEVGHMFSDGDKIGLVYKEENMQLDCRLVADL